LLIETPHNCKVTAFIMGDNQLIALITVEQHNLGFADFHMQIQSSLPHEHNEKCFPQPFKQSVWCLLLLIFLMFIM
jgi:hypothetical protein